MSNPQHQLTGSEELERFDALLQERLKEILQYAMFSHDDSHSVAVEEIMSYFAQDRMLHTKDLAKARRDGQISELERLREDHSDTSGRVMTTKSAITKRIMRLASMEKTWYPNYDRCPRELHK